MLEGLINIGSYSSQIPFQLLQEHAFEMISYRKWLEQLHLQPHWRSSEHAWFNSLVYHSRDKQHIATHPPGGTNKVTVCSSKSNKFNLNTGSGSL